jgi:hypothetical protein
MPYNPSSAYPRHSTYTPPVYGRGFARGFNEWDWGNRIGQSMHQPGANVGHTLDAATRRPSNENIIGALTAQNRKGLGSALLAAMVDKPAQMRKTVTGRMMWNRAEYGDDPNEMGPPQAVRAAASHLEDINAGVGAWPASTGARPMGPITTAGSRSGTPGVAQVLGADDPFGAPADPGQTGGRAHVGGVNDRIGAIVDRVTTSSTMNDVAQRVLSGGLGGPMTVPKLVFGAARAANRRRKGA